jgi:hypothetical protein
MDGWTAAGATRMSASKARSSHRSRAHSSENWLEATGNVLGGESYFPKLPPRGAVAAQVVRSSPAGGSFAMYTMFLLGMSSARQSIYLTNPYFLPDDRMTRVLTEAPRRGVRVVVLVPGRSTTTSFATPVARSSGNCSRRASRSTSIRRGCFTRRPCHRRHLGHDRQHQPGQPLLRAQRGAQCGGVRQGRRRPAREGLRGRSDVLSEDRLRALAGSRRPRPAAELPLSRSASSSSSRERIR